MNLLLWLFMRSSTSKKIYKSEADFERDCVKILQSLPSSYWPPKGEPGATIGNADRVGCVNGIYVSLEFKKSLMDYLKRTPRTKLQAYNASMVKHSGGFAAFVYPENWPLVLKQIKELIIEV